MTEQALCNAMRLHGGAVYRLALCRTQNAADAEDVYQDVFLRFFQQETADWDSEHTRAWLLRATVNRCTDIHRFRLRRPVLALEDIPELARPADDSAAELWDAVARLPEKLRTVVHLHYAEGVLYRGGGRTAGGAARHRADPAPPGAAEAERPVGRYGG